MYGQDGYMSVAIMDPERTKFASGDLLSGSPQERTQAAGRYEFRRDTVVHHVELSLFPDWVGVEQERLVQVKGDRLMLSARPILLGGVQRTAHLILEAVGRCEQ